MLLFVVTLIIRIHLHTKGKLSLAVAIPTYVLEELI
jgi:hypothetical protein